MILVGEGDSIQRAVEMANPGDTILVGAGRFNEYVTLAAGKDRLRIIGEGHGETILDGNGLGDVSGFTVSGSRFVTISGFTVRGFSGFGFEVEAPDAVICRNQVEHNAAGGIRVASPRCLVKGNTVAHNGGEGIRVESGALSYVVDNTVAKNGAAGIDVGTGASHVLVCRNEAGRNAGAGIRVASGGSWIVSNKVSGNRSDGIAVVGENVLLSANKSTGNVESGLGLDVSGLIAAGNAFRENRKGGVAALPGEENSSCGRIESSLLLDNEMCANKQCGVRSGANLVRSLIFGNKVTGNGGDGFDLEEAEGNRFAMNVVDGNRGSGIDASQGRFQWNLIDDNRFARNRGSGLPLGEAARGNAVRANAFKDDKPYDIEVRGDALSGNTVDDNACKRSSPPGIGG